MELQVQKCESIAELQVQKCESIAELQVQKCDRIAVVEDKFEFKEKFVVPANKNVAEAQEILR